MPEQNEALNRGITPEMLKGINSIFDGATEPTEDMNKKLQDLYAAQLEHKQKKEYAPVSGGVANVESVRALYRKPTGTIVRDHKIGRNDMCPCGSGKKYKNCCMNTGKYESVHEV